MDVHSCMHCGNPVLDGAATCSSCGADLTGTAEAPYPRELTPGRDPGGLERYEIPWFDLPMAFRVIHDPSEVSPLNADATVGKYATRAFLLSAVGFVLSFSPLFVAGFLPALLGIVWALMVARVARRHHIRRRRTLSALAFGLGVFACASVTLSILLTLAAGADGT